MLDETDWLEEVDDLEVDFNNLRRKHVKGGYREGVTAGQEYSLQSSFNNGFFKGSSYYEKLASYRGCLTSIMMFLLGMNDQCPESVIRKIEEAILLLEKLEDKEMHINTILDDHKTSINFNSKLTNLDSIKAEPVEVGLLDDLSDAMKQSFTTIDEDDDMMMEDTGAENEKCNPNCQCVGKNHTNGNEVNSCDGVKKQCSTNNGVEKTYDGEICGTGNISDEKSKKLFKETIVAMQEIALDVLQNVEGYFTPLIFHKIKHVLLE